MLRSGSSPIDSDPHSDTSVITLQKLTVVESDVSKLSGEVKSLKMNSAATLRHVDGLLSIQQSKSLISRYSRVKSKHANLGYRRVSLQHL